MCDECYDDSYVNYPVYVHPPPVRSYEEYPKRVGKIADALLGLGVVPREGESVYEYVVENEERPRLPIELVIWPALAGYFALRDGFRAISRRLDGACLHPTHLVCASIAIQSERMRQEDASQ